MCINLINLAAKIAISLVKSLVSTHCPSAVINTIVYAMHVHGKGISQKRGLTVFHLGNVTPGADVTGVAISD